ncbi:MAG: hypothetical protein ABSG86_26230 [Thermoguttaceae bacterium]|jgi:hypothetical protein
MPVFSGNSGETVLASPGLYVIGARGVMPGGGPGTTPLSPCGTGAGSNGAAAERRTGLLVSLLGDFVVSRLAATGSDRPVTLNGRLPLGWIERLEDADVLEVRPVDGFDANRSAAVRVTYFRRKGPPIRCVVPVTSSLRCSYSGKRLAGVPTVRCSGCFRLYHEEAAWRADLDGMCPTCGWSNKKGGL